MFGLVQYLCISFDFISLPNSVSISTRLEEPVDRLIIFSKSHRYGYNGYEHAWAGPPERTNWSIDEIIYTIKLKYVKEFLKAAKIKENLAHIKLEWEIFVKYTIKHNKYFVLILL